MKRFKFTFWCAIHTGVYSIEIEDEVKVCAYYRALRRFAKYLYVNNLNCAYIKIECEEVTL